MSEKRSKIDAILLQFKLQDDVLSTLSDLLLQDFNKGLSAEHHESSTVKMFPTYVTSFPNRSEKGKYLALDLGGSNFRVLCVEFDDAHYEITGEIYELPPEVIKGPGKQLFDFLAKCIEMFLEGNGLENEELALGFTFSFPCLQTSLTNATLIKWTKGFVCSDVVGEDVVELLRDAIRRREKISIEIIAIVNDTTGTLMSVAYFDSNCKIGLIIGTGCNACYVEEVENIELLTSSVTAEQMVINTELGGFGDDGCLDFIRTEFDCEIDEDSPNKGRQIFEKMISGLYMGEIVRKIIVKLYQDKLLFHQNLPQKLQSKDSFKSKYISMIESDTDKNYEETKKILRSTGFIEIPEEDCEIVKDICTQVSTRAAALSAVAVATMLNKMKRSETTVAIDGSVYRYHPHFKERMQKKIEELVNPKYKFNLELSEDGSGRGAALVAAAAVRERSTQNK